VSAKIHTILVVDDEFLIREPLAEHLEGCGFKVFSVANAEEAIAVLRKPGAAIDLVFSDVNMPGPLNGFGLAKWIRSNMPDVFVILTSGDAMKEKAAKELCLEEPVVAKPYRLESVAAKIHSILNISPRGREPNLA
jgi:CheY-like chemotaxis protein